MYILSALITHIGFFLNMRQKKSSVTYGCCFQSNGAVTDYSVIDLNFTDMITEMKCKHCKQNATTFQTCVKTCFQIHSHSRVFFSIRGSRWFVSLNHLGRLTSLEKGRAGSLRKYSADDWVSLFIKHYVQPMTNNVMATCMSTSLGAAILL